MTRHLDEKRLTGSNPSHWSETESTGRPSVRDAGYSLKWNVDISRDGEKEGRILQKTNVTTACFGAVTNGQEPLSNPYQTSELCPVKSAQTTLASALPV
jgi:hypothetical protein